MTQMLWVPGPLPGMNDIIAAAKGAGGRGARYAAMKRKWTDAVAFRARAERIHPVPGKAYLRFFWHERDQRRDLDNIAAAKKFVIDGLVVAKVLAGDGWAHVVGWNDAFVVTGKPGVEIAIFASPET